MSRACTFDDLKPWPADLTPTGKHYPVPDVGPLPRVTSIIDSTVGLFSSFLQNWYAKTEREAVLQTVRQQFAWGSGMTPEGFVGMVEAHLGETRAAVKAMQAAADIGTETHKAIQAYLRRELGLPHAMPVLGDGATLAFMAWEEWWLASGYKPLRIEQVVWDADLRYAGCIDLLAEAPDGAIDVIDWKSSNYILLKHHLQVASYLSAANRWRPVRGAKIIRVPKTLERIAIEEKPLGAMYDPEKRKDFTLGYADLMEGFRAARALYRIFIERPMDGSARNGGDGT